MNNPGLPKRLRNNREFRRVYEQGRRYHTPFFNGFLRASEGLSPRIGFTVTKKIGNSVVRNRCKRRMRELVRRYLLQHPQLAKVGIELVLNAKNALVLADYSQLEMAFFRMMQSLLGDGPGRKEKRKNE
jgi:ribonuclease P protein component